tara:strand:+ start:714 stop:1124 length:411 start_codon:yes stop_codon:yes gene_type:complete
MVSQDAYDKLHNLEVVTAKHGEQFKAYEHLLAQNTETLKEVKNVLIDNARFSERLNNMDKRQDHDELKYEKLEQKVQINQNKIVYWSGGIAASLIFAGIIFSAFKLQPAPISAPSVQYDSHGAALQHQTQQRNKTQ